jgi:hypothetical protein
VSSGSGVAAAAIALEGGAACNDSSDGEVVELIGSSLEATTAAACFSDEEERSFVATAS